MTLLVMLLLAQAGPAAMPAPPDDDIVVIGQRMKRLRIVTGIDRRTGITRCVFKRRSGDPRLDAGVCETVLACVAKEQTEAAVVACMKPPMAALVPKTPWRAGAAGDR